MRKYVIVAMASLFMLGSTLTAQQQAPQRQQRPERKEVQKADIPQLSAEKKAERMAKELQLTEREQKKVQELFEKQEQRRKKHEAELEKQKEKFRKMYEAERKAHDAELEKIIGKEKFEQLQAKRAEQLEKLKQRKGSTRQDTLRSKPAPRERMRR